MTRKEIKWNWGERQQKAFEKLKEKFTTELVLVTLDLDNKIKVKADILDFVIGEVLLIKYEDKKWRLVDYISELLNKTKKTMKFIIKKYWQLSDIQKYGGISWKELRVSLKFGQTIKTWNIS